MKATAHLNAIGQSLWLDDITRALLNSGTLKRYIDEFSVTGLTSNPTIFDNAISHSGDYDEEISRLMDRGQSGEDLFFELAIQDLTRAAELFRPVHDRTATVDGWVSLEVSPLLAYDTEATVAQAKSLHKRAGLPNLFIKIPGTKEGLPAIEEAIFAGIPVNVTLLFSAEHYEAAAGAYIKGLERRLEAGLSPDVRSVASVFISRWDRAISGKVPTALHNKLGVAVGQKAYATYRTLLNSDRWQRLENEGARPQRLLFASTSMKDKASPDTLYVSGLAAPNTIDTMPDATLNALADHGTIERVMSRDGGPFAETLADFAKAGVDVPSLAAQLQSDGAKSFVDSWQELLKTIEAKSKALA